MACRHTCLAVTPICQLNHPTPGNPRFQRYHLLPSANQTTPLYVCLVEHGIPSTVLSPYPGKRVNQRSQRTDTSVDPASSPSFTRISKLNCRQNRRKGSPDTARYFIHTRAQRVYLFLRASSAMVNTLRCAEKASPQRYVSRG